MIQQLFKSFKYSEMHYGYLNHTKLTLLFLLEIPWKHIVVALPTAVHSIRPLTARWSNSVFKEKLHVINMGGSAQGG